MKCRVRRAQHAELRPRNPAAVTARPCPTPALMGVWITEGQLLRATYLAVIRYGPVNAIGLKLGLGRRLR